MHSTGVAPVLPPPRLPPRSHRTLVYSELAVALLVAVAAIKRARRWRSSLVADSAKRKAE